MKITLDLRPLKRCLDQMGAPLTAFTSTVDAKPISLEFEKRLKDGIIEIKPEDIEIVSGLLNYKGYQVIVYIPDHSYEGVPMVVDNPRIGRKYHFAECSTIQEMKKSQRFNKRYFAVQDPEGLFRIVDGNKNEAKVALQVCQNCLKHVNFEGFNRQGMNRTSVVNHLKPRKIFETYSTIFSELPNSREDAFKVGYPQDWKEISEQYRAQQNWTCESCGVDMGQHRHLLHTHHINGNKQDCEHENLKALCFDCHRREPQHDHMLISHQEMQTINLLRYEQGILDLIYENQDWSRAFALSDKSLHGLLHHYQDKGFKCPAIYYPLKFNGKSIFIDLAWPQNKKGVMLKEADYERAKEAGWVLNSLEKALGLINK